MRRIAFALLILATVGTSAVLAQKDKDKMKVPEPQTVSGIIVDMKCYSMNSANSGDEHITPKGKMPACATVCAKMGIPVGIAVEDENGSELIVLISPSGAFADHMAKEAKITGTPALDGHGLIPDKIQVKTDGKWEEVKIATMM